MVPKNFRGDATYATFPPGRRLFQEVVAMKVRIVLDIAFPLPPEDDIRFGFVGKDQE